jgi:glycosyltransferase involved in cell wall biosynthesis
MQPCSDHHTRPPLVSVVIPTYNRAELLAECLSSVGRQTHRPLEVIVADDGSTDGTAEVVAGFREQAARRDGLAVAYLPLPRGGAPKARNAGVERAAGEFIHYMDSDDLIHARKIEWQVAAFERFPDADFVWGLYSYFDESPPQDVAYGVPELLNEARHCRAERWPEVPRMVPIGLFRRSACARIGPWCESLTRWQDVEYMLRFANTRPRLVRLPAVLYYARRHSAGQITDLYKTVSGVRGGFQSLETIERSMPAIPAPDHEVQIAMSNLYKSLAETALQCGLKQEFRDALRGATRHRRDLPFRARALGIDIVCSCLGAAWALKLLRGYHAARLPSPPDCVA